MRDPLGRCGTGADPYRRQARFETTAAEAEREAPNQAVAQEIENNAENAQQVAEQAAKAAAVSVQTRLPRTI